MAWIGAAIAGAAALGSALLANRGRKKDAQRTAAANKELAQYSYQRDLEMWQRQNEYNDPKAQMSRYQGAGLNPMNIYGTGSASAGNSSSAPDYKAPTVDLRRHIDVPNILGMYQDFQMRQAQIDNVNAQTENTNARTITEAYRKLLMQFGAEGKEIEVKEILPHQAEIMSHKGVLDVEEQLQRIRNMSREEQIRNLDIMYKSKGIEIQQIQKESQEAELLYKKYRNQWLSMGITGSDNVLLRIFVRMLKESGLSPENLFGQ